MNEYANVEVEVSDNGFTITGSFPDIVPISHDTTDEEAANLQTSLSNSMSSRLVIIGRVLNLIARGSSMKAWIEFDLFLTALITLLDQSGVEGIVDCISQES